MGEQAGFSQVKSETKNILKGDQEGRKQFASQGTRE